MVGIRAMSEQHPSTEPTVRVTPADPADSAATASTLDLILKTTGGYCVARALHVAADLGVADCIADAPATMAGVATRLEVDPEGSPRANHAHIGRSSEKVRSDRVLGAVKPVRVPLAPLHRPPLGINARATAAIAPAFPVGASVRRRPNVVAEPTRPIAVSLALWLALFSGKGWRSSHHAEDATSHRGRQKLFSHCLSPLIVQILVNPHDQENV